MVKDEPEFPRCYVKHPYGSIYHFNNFNGLARVLPHAYLAATFQLTQVNESLRAGHNFQGYICAVVDNLKVFARIDTGSRYGRELATHRAAGNDREAIPYNGNETIH